MVNFLYRYVLCIVFVKGLKVVTEDSEYWQVLRRNLLEKMEKFR